MARQPSRDEIDTLPASVCIDTYLGSSGSCPRCAIMCVLRLRKSPTSAPVAGNRDFLSMPRCIAARVSLSIALLQRLTYLPSISRNSSNDDDVDGRNAIDLHSADRKAITVAETETEDRSFSGRQILLLSVVPSAASAAIIYYLWLLPRICLSKFRWKYGCSKY